MKIDGFMYMFKVIFITIFKNSQPNLNLVLWLFSLICDDRVFTREQMMLQVIKNSSEKLYDKNILFSFFEYLF